MAFTLGVALSPTWLRGSAWRAPDSGVEEMFSLRPYAELARAAEDAGADVLFVPDAGYLDESVIEQSPGFSTLDSHTLVSALVAHTTRVRLVPTVQTSFASPYDTARRLQSLHQLSGGRAGWNAVTALGGNDNHGTSGPSHPLAPLHPEDRYARAAEFIRIVEELWESYPADAFIADRATGRFADTSRVRSVDIEGDHFRVRGPLSVPAHPSPKPPLFQAGASERATALAGAAADAVFACTPDEDSAQQQRTALRHAAQRAGRAADAVAFLPGFSFVLDTDRDAAHARAASHGTRGAAHWTVIGTPADARDAVRKWRDSEAIDGIIALAGGGQESIRLFMEEVAPAIRD